MARCGGATADSMRIHGVFERTTVDVTPADVDGTVQGSDVVHDGHGRHLAGGVFCSGAART